MTDFLYQCKKCGKSFTSHGLFSVHYYRCEG